MAVEVGVAGQGPVIVNVEQVNRGCGCGGCLTFIAVLLVIGFAIEYWYIAVGIVAAAAIIGGLVWANQRAEEADGADAEAKSRGELWTSSTSAVVELCGSCGAQITGAFCANCGAARSRRCAGCGTELTTPFCPNCGRAADT